MPERLPPRGPPRPEQGGEPEPEEPRTTREPPAPDWRNPPPQPFPAPPLQARPGLFSPRAPPAAPAGAEGPPGPRPATTAGQFDLFAAKAAGARPLTVLELTRQLKGMIEGRFPSVTVEGEISNAKTPSSGHLYFTLKDDEACIDAVVFRKELQRLRFTPRSGLSVLVRGRLSLWEASGRYQIICDSVEPLGAGALQLAFEQLKERLQREGLFARERKRALPFLPRRIALVTSPSGAAVHDFLRVLHRRFPNLPVLIVPAKVQGEGAAQEIARGIARAAAQPGVDVVVVTRGGGSLEDLWAFNEEVVARALAACPVPTVSAVGHEVDVSIADYVADARAATPTAAAELLAKVKQDLVDDVAEKRARLWRALRGKLEQRRGQLEARRARLLDPRRLLGDRRLLLDRLEQRLLAAARRGIEARAQGLQRQRERLDRAHPSAQLHRLRREVALLEQRLGSAARKRLGQARQRFEVAVGRLDAMSPLRVLARGYAVAFDDAGRALRDAAETRPGAAVRVRLARGELEAKVTAVRPGQGEPER